MNQTTTTDVHRRIVFVFVLVLAGGPSIALGQSTDGHRSAYSPPRTAWGVPDLQGIWTNDTITPFERPVQLGDRSVFTDQEVEEQKHVWRNRHGVPVSPQLTVAERFTRVGEHELDWQVMVTDPVYYNAPRTVRLPLRGEPGYQIYEYACHEGNHAITGILGGARVQERK